MPKLVLVPNDVLSHPVKPVKKIDKRIKKIIKEMIETLEAQNDPPGVGLSANQVGIPLSIFLMKPTERSKPRVFINPKILKLESDKKKKENKKTQELEGCLSIPKIWGVVKRPKKVLLRWQTIEGKEEEKWFTGLEAIIVQHEVDHLNGIVFTQRAVEQGSTLYKEKSNGEFEEL